MNEIDERRRRYLVGAAVVWVAISAATVVTLAGTPHASQMFPVVAGGALYVVLVVPRWLFR